MAGDTMEAAVRVKGHQGFHETEISFGGEADLHQHLIGCTKNPGHTQFIPVQNFKLEHLPSTHKDSALLEYIRAEANMTCRLSVRYTSHDRPQFYPGRKLLYPFYPERGGNFLRTGTGWVRRVDKFTEADNRICECAECRGPGTHTPKKTWIQMDIQTAAHVVFDEEEAKETTCHFFYDTSSTRVGQCPSFCGLTLKRCNVQRDWCLMTYVTHDLGLADEIFRMYLHLDKKWKNVLNKYWVTQKSDTNVPMKPRVSDPTPGPVVVISHPHGCSKQITIGAWTERQTIGETYKYEEGGLEGAYKETCYTYNTPTCPGSSGAPVFTLPEEGRWWWSCHPHSEGRTGNNNSSGRMHELVSPLTAKSMAI